MGNGFKVDTGRLRATAADLRQAMLPEVESAHGRLLEHFGAEILGPTAAPAEWEFREAWRAELKATVEAIRQLAATLEDTAAHYEETDRLTGQAYRGATR